MPTWGEILLCSSYPTQIVLGQLLMFAGITPLDAGGSLSSQFVFILSIADTVVLVSLIVFLLMRRGGLLIRINPRESDVPRGQISLPLGALDALQHIDSLLGRIEGRGPS